jgi:hypothetical protein
LHSVHFPKMGLSILKEYTPNEGGKNKHRRHSTEWPGVLDGSTSGKQAG